MPGIYIHIPFCRQACHYCNFHFTTSLRYKDDLLAALLKEIPLRKNYLDPVKIETIYFGGGTPSLCTAAEIKKIITGISEQFEITSDAEITLEANPDDITEEKLVAWKEAGINRPSIGIQSFFEEDLKWMNRAHNAEQARQCLQWATRYFNNITIDLIYGTPGLTNEKWQQNVQTAIDLDIPHLSCYALTVEPKTPLQKMIELHRVDDIDADQQSEQFLLLMDWLEKAGYEQYEISNFAKPGWRSRHNSSYWSIGPLGKGKQYLGLGPSAHSFNGISRQWNIANNNLYIESINKGIIPFEAEELTATQKLNEYIMTSLRTAEGLNLAQVEEKQKKQLEEAAQKFVQAGLMTVTSGSLRLTREGRLLADGIAAAMFF